MKTKKNILSKKLLRQKAEKIISKDLSEFQKIPTEDLKELIEELQIHQVELELQNEDLLQTQLELETIKDNYTDLYDFAPVGYFTIDNNGIIREANLTVSFLLETERQNLIGIKFTSFIFKDDQDIFHIHRKNIEEKQVPQTCELRINKKSGGLLWAKLVTVTKKGMNNHTYLRIAVMDISERIENEKQKEKLIKELQDSLGKIKTLRGLIPICANCKKIRNDEGYYEKLELYISQHTESQFSHGICPDCAEKLYPDYVDKDNK